jgi:hypothetical protein
VPEGVAGEPRPADRILPLLDVLLGGAAAVVQLDRALVGSGQVGHYEADARIKLALWRDITDVTDPHAELMAAIEAFRQRQLATDRAREIRRSAVCSADRGAEAESFYDDFGERRLEATDGDMILL